MNPHPDIPQPQPARALTATSWLQAAAPQDDYYQGKHPKVDTSIWALLFSWLPPAGLALGIVGVIKGFSGTKSRAAVVWGILAILISLGVPVLVYEFFTHVPTQLQVGSTVTSSVGLSVKVPADAHLLDDSNNGLLYAVGDAAAPTQTYGVYWVAPATDSSGRSTVAAPGAGELVAILDDSSNGDYAFWTHQLFSSNGLPVDSIDSTRVYKDTAEIVMTSAGRTVLANVHTSNNVLFVQYMMGDIPWLSLSVTLAHVTESEGGQDVASWHELIDSFSYKPTRSWDGSANSTSGNNQETAS